MTKYHYKPINRRAEVGELIVIVDAAEEYNAYEDGSVFIVEDVDDSGIYNKLAGRGLNPNGHIYHTEYNVLEPKLDHGEESTSNTVDLIVNLSQTVASLATRINYLETQVSANTDNVRTFGEDVTKASYKAGQALTTAAQTAETTEMLEDDVVMLDERTQPLVADGVTQFATELTDMIERKINENEVIRRRFK